MRNCALELQRKHRRERGVGEPHDNIEDPSLTPEALAAEQELNRLLYQVIFGSAPDLSECLRLALWRRAPC